MHMKKHLGYFLLIKSYNCQLDKHGQIEQHEIFPCWSFKEETFVKKSMMLE